MMQSVDEVEQTEDRSSPDRNRITSLGDGYGATMDRLPALCDVAIDGLHRMALPDMHFAHTLRSIGTKNHPQMSTEGDNLRYAINVAQGLAWTPEEVQRDILGGQTAIDLALDCVKRAAVSREPGAVALAAWAAAETAGVFAGELFALLHTILENNRALPTVACAWALTASLAARHLGDTRDLQRLATIKLTNAQSPSGLFPHVVPALAAGWGRSHIGSFADQVYPIQAFARLGLADNDRSALYAANACAARIVALQGPAGQWWWHYDTRDGKVVEGYPVYSVHQHAMAPMALLDLVDAGGVDYRSAVAKGLRWIDARPETDQPMVSVEDGTIWRKVGRTEPPKLARKLAAMTTAVAAGWHLPFIDRALPADKVDRECRPYEFGWMLYAWRSQGVVEKLRRPL